MGHHSDRRLRELSVRGPHASQPHRVGGAARRRVAAGRAARAFVSRASGACLQARPVASAGALAAERGWWGTYQAHAAGAGQLAFLVFELPLPPSVTECGIDSSSSMRVVSSSRASGRMNVDREDLGNGRAREVAGARKTPGSNVPIE
jgi:hypothetical protein